jgi:hypothetical protein
VGFAHNNKPMSSIELEIISFASLLLLLHIKQSENKADKGGDSTTSKKLLDL